MGEGGGGLVISKTLHTGRGISVFWKDTFSDMYRDQKILKKILKTQKN